MFTNQNLSVINKCFSVYKEKLKLNSVFINSFFNNSPDTHKFKHNQNEDRLAKINVMMLKINIAFENKEVPVLDAKEKIIIQSMLSFAINHIEGMMIPILENDESLIALNKEFSHQIQLLNNLRRDLKSNKVI